MPRAAGKATFGAIIGIFSSLFLLFLRILSYLCNRKSLEKVAEQNKKSLEKRARIQEKSLEKRVQHQEQRIINH